MFGHTDVTDCQVLDGDKRRGKCGSPVLLLLLQRSVFFVAASEPSFP